MIKFYILVSAFLLPLSAVETLPNLKLTSEHMKSHNPLLPKLEPELWQKLLLAEKAMASSSDGDKKRTEFLETAAQLTNLHKLERKEHEIKLGGISWNKKDNTIVIPAKVKYPNPGMPLEVLLCQRKGRAHETVFVTETRPLHLEVLLHMAGFKLGSLFRISVQAQETVGIEQFLRWKSKDDKPVLWKFTGSEFGKEYIPDNAGEQIIIWGRNEAVLDVARKDFSSLKVPVYGESLKAFPKGVSVKLILTQAATVVSHD